MSIIREFTLYLHAGITTPEVIHANQYSQGETWIFKLLQDDGSVYVPSTGALIGVKADGHAIAGLTGTVLGDGRVSITTTQQLTAAAGDATCELTIDGGTNGSANFVIRVEKKPTDDAILSESDLSIIQEGMNSVTPVVIAETVSDWLEDNLTDPPIDPTLSISNAAADAKVTGDKITELKTAINLINEVIGDVEIETEISIGNSQTGGWQGSVGNTLTISSATSYRSYSVSAEVGKTYKLNTRRSSSNNYPYYIYFVDDNDIVISAYGSPSSSGYEEIDFIAVCPTGATKICFLSQYQYTPTLYIVTYKTITDELEKKEDKIYSNVFVSNDGSDSNDGTISAPKKTIASALATGKETIFIKAGTYDESITANNRKIIIKPYDGDEIILSPSESVNNCVALTKCDVDITGLTVKGADNYSDASPTYKVQRNGMYLIACTGMLKNCASKGARTAGIRMDGSVLRLENCKALYNGIATGTDGFNAHDYTDESNNVFTSEITLVNCEADHNGDDGVSVHEYGSLYVYGGKFTNNAVGGVTPYGQCRCEVHESYIAYNKFGVDGFQSADATYPDGQSGILASKPTVLSVGNRIENNSQYAISVSYYNCVSIGDMLRDNTNDIREISGTVTAF